MSESRRGVFARNIFSNMAGYAVSAAVALFLTKYVQESLDQYAYGLWLVVVALTGYYMLLDLGVRSAVGQYVTRYLAKNDIDGVNRTLGTAFRLLVYVALLALFVTIGLSLTLPMWVKDLGTMDAVDAQSAMLIIGGGVSVGLPMALFSSVPYARERFDIINAILITENILRAVLSVAVLSYGGGVLSLAIVVTAVQLLAGVARVFFAYRLLPGLHVRMSNFQRDSVRELGSFGLYNFLVNAADRIVLHTDVIIITAIIGSSITPLYANGAMLIPFYMQLVLMVTWTLTPYATACDARGDRAALASLLLNGTRGSVFLAAVIGAGLYFTGGEFLHLFLPEKNLVNPAYQNSAGILLILTFATLARASSSCGRQILFGMRRMRLLAGLSFTEAVLNLGISLILVHTHELAGVAYGTLIPVILVYTIAQNYFVGRLVDVSHAEHIGQILRAAVPVGAAMSLVGLWLEDWLVADTWLRFGLKVVLLLVPVVPIGYLIVMNRDERRDLWQRLPFGQQGSAA